MFKQIRTTTLTREVIVELRKRTGFDCSIDTAIRMEFGLPVPTPTRTYNYSCSLDPGRFHSITISKESAAALISATQIHHVDMALRQHLGLPQKEPDKRSLRYVDGPIGVSAQEITNKAQERFKGSHKWEIKSYEVGKYEGI